MESPFEFTVEIFKIYENKNMQITDLIEFCAMGFFYSFT